MSYYNLFEVDIIQTSQLFLGGGVGQPLPSTGQVLYSDGYGGTYWSTTSGDTQSFTSTVVGLGTAGYASTSYVTGQISSFSTALGFIGSGNLTTGNLTSTVIGLGTAGYASTSFVTSEISSFSTSLGSVGSGNLTTSNLISTVVGLGTSGYISSQQLTSTVVGLNIFISSFIDFPELQSTVIGLGSAGYASTSYVTSQISTFSTSLGQIGAGTLTSTVIGLGASGYISSLQLLSTVQGLNTYISSFIDTTELTSTLIGLGTLGYFSTIGIYSTVTGLYNFIQDDIGSTIVGLGTAGFISSIGLDAKLASTTNGLGTAGYISSLPNNLISSPFLNTTLASTTAGLGTAGYISSQQLTSTTESITSQSAAGSNYFQNLLLYNGSTSLTSTVVGLGNIYLSTAGTGDVTNQQLQSTVIGLGIAGYASTIAVQQLSNYTINTLQDWSTSVSTVSLYTSNTSNFSRNLLQNTSTWVSTVALFTSNTSNFARNILQDFSTPISTFSTSISQQIITQSLTVSSITFNTGDGYLIFPDIVTLSLSTFIVNTSSITANVFVGDGSLLTNLPAVSSLSLQSTVVGLGTAGYASTSFVTEEISSFSTSLGQIGSGNLTTSNLNSTIIGLGTFGFISSPQLISTVIGIGNIYLSTGGDSGISDVELRSTVVGLGNIYLSTGGGGGISQSELTSSFIGLGNFGYISSFQNISSSTIQANLGIFSTFQTSTLLTNILVASDSQIDRLLVSSICFFDGDGFLRLDDVQLYNLSSVFIQTQALSTQTLAVTTQFAGTISTNLINASTINAISSFFSTTFINLLNVSTINIENFSTGLINQIRISTLITNEAFISTALISSLSTTTAGFNYLQSISSYSIESQVDRLLVSSLRFFDGDGFLRLDDVQLYNLSSVYIQTQALSTQTLAVITQFAGTISTNLLNASTVNAVSSFFSTSFINLLNVSSINIQNFSTGLIDQIRISTLITNEVFISTAQISSLSTTTAGFNYLQSVSSYSIESQIDRLLVSSVRFFDGDGFLRLDDVQLYNLSSVYIQTQALSTQILVTIDHNSRNITAQSSLFSTITTNTLFMNNSTPLFSLDVNGDARISSLTIAGPLEFTSTNTTFPLTVWAASGPARVGGTTWTQISDQRIKENIVEADYERCYEDIKAIPLRRFTYMSSVFQQVPLVDKNVLGFIAQEVSTIQPKSITVSEAFGISDLNWLNIDQMNMSLYGAVKKLISNHEQLLSSFVNMNEFYLSKISTLESRCLGNV